MNDTQTYVAETKDWMNRRCGGVIDETRHDITLVGSLPDGTIGITTLPRKTFKELWQCVYQWNGKVQAEMWVRHHFDNGLEISDEAFAQLTALVPDVVQTYRAKIKPRK